MPSVIVWFMAPRRSVSVDSDTSNPGNSTCTFTAPVARGGSVATPRSSDITVIGSPEAGVTTTVAEGMPAPV